MDNFKLNLIGTFYVSCMEFVKSYKVGGHQRLQKLIGSELLYRPNKDWYFRNQNVILLTHEQLSKLIQTIKSKTR